MIPFCPENDNSYTSALNSEKTLSVEELAAITSLGNIFYDHPTLLYGITDAHITNRAALYKIIETIIKETLVSGRFFNEFYMKRFVHGEDDSFQHGCLISGNSVRRIIEILVNANVVISRRYYSNSYGLGMNLDLLRDHLEYKIRRLKAKCSFSESCLHVLGAHLKIKSQYYALDSAASKIRAIIN